MTAFIVAVFFGILQTFLLNGLVGAVTSGNQKKMLLFLLVKFVTYGVAIALMMFKFFDYYLYCFCGFAAGMPLSAVLLFIYKTFFKKQKS